MLPGHDARPICVSLPSPPSSPSFHPLPSWVRGGRNPSTVKVATNAGQPREGGRELLSLTFQELGIETETVPYHDRPHRNGMRGIFCKNLFLKDRKGQFYLIICAEDKAVNLKQLKIQLQAHRNFSFCPPDDLRQKLGVAPGAVTPLGLLFDDSSSITVVIDESLITNPDVLLNFHPLTPEETTLLTFQDLCAFIKHTGHSLRIERLE